MKRISKKLIISGLFVMGFTFVGNTIAQDLKSAIKLTDSEQFNAATEIYQNLIKQQPQNADIYFYFGESYLKSFFTDTANVDLQEVTLLAKAQFEKGVAADPANPLNYVGMGKASLYSGNYTLAAADFVKAESLIPVKQSKTMTLSLEKQVIAFQKIAEGYLKAPNADTGKVFPYLRKAEKLDKKNAITFLLRGDAYLFLINDGSNAIINYKRAQELDPSSPKAKMRLGQLWVRAKRYQEALDYYKEAIQIDSTFTPCYRERAELYAMAGQYENAQVNYKKFLALSGQNISAKVRFASFLFLTKKYSDAITQINEILLQDQSYTFLYRLAGYSYFETSQPDLALKSIQKFFANTKPEKVICSDYTYFGKIYSKLSSDSLAIEKYRLALKCDSSNMDIIPDMASSYNKMKKYGETAKLYELKIRKGVAVTNDYYSLGKAYYSDQQWGKADTAFSIVNQKNSDFIPAFLWKARVYSNLDPETKDGLAKPHYELLAEKAKADTVKYSKELIECYSYLGYYYLKSKKFCESIDYWQKVLFIDPKNEKATGAIKDLKTRCPGK